MDKESFIFHSDTLPAIEAMTDSQAGKLLKALCRYRRGLEVPTLSGSVHTAFILMSQMIDRDDEKFIKTVEARREAGRKGGLASGVSRSKTKQSEANEAKPSKRSESESESVSVSDSVSVTSLQDVVVERACARDTTKTTSLDAYKKPTVEEVAAYCRDHNYGIDPAAFVDYYEANGWMCGRSHMKDWKAAVRTWDRKEKAKSSYKGDWFEGLEDGDDAERS